MNVVPPVTSQVVEDEVDLVARGERVGEGLAGYVLFVDVRGAVRMLDARDAGLRVLARSRRELDAALQTDAREATRVAADRLRRAPAGSEAP